MSINNKTVNKISEDIKKDRIEELRKILPEVFEEGKIDLEKLKLTLGEEIDERPERFNFTWAGKNKAIKTVLTQSKATLKPAKDESIKFDENENLIIEGDNLEVLKLLQKTYFEKVKMIYIDPPYNTGGDFVYHDDFSAPINSYLKQTGQLDEEGNKQSTNKETNGRYHSDWLSMMYSRLKLAWNLLTDTGVIFVSIGDEEVHHLKIVLNEVFGEDNFEGHIHWRRRHNQPNDKTKMIGLVGEHILAFAKNSQELKKNGVGKVELTGKFTNPDNDPRGDWASKPWKVGSAQSGTKYTITSPTGAVFEEVWMGDEKNYNKLLADNRIIFPKKGEGLPRKKYFKFEREEEGQCATNWWNHEEFGSNQDGSNELTKIFGNTNIFDNPKPVKLIKNLIAISNAKDNDIVLDFFAGSGTTGQAVLELNEDDNQNLKFILIQLPEQSPATSEAYKAGFTTITEITKERVRRVIKGYGENPKSIDTGFKVFKLAPSNYPEISYEFDPEKTEEENQKSLLEYLAKTKQTSLLDKSINPIDIVYENIVKEGFSLNSKITEGKVDGNHIFIIEDGENEMRISLDEKISQETVKKLSDLEFKGKTFVCYDNALSDSDKANIGLNLELKTI